jgi:hypothetical protein
LFSIFELPAKSPPSAPARMPVLSDLSNTAMPALGDLNHALRVLSTRSTEADRLSVCQRIREAAQQCTAKGSSDRSWTEPARLAVLKLTHEDASDAVRVAAQDARIALEACVRDVPAWGSPAGSAAPLPLAHAVPVAAMAPGAPPEHGSAVPMGALHAFFPAIDAPMVDAASAAAVTAAYPVSCMDDYATTCESHPPQHASSDGVAAGGVGGTERALQPSNKRDSPGDGVSRGHVPSASSGGDDTGGGGDGHSFSAGDGEERGSQGEGSGDGPSGGSGSSGGSGGGEGGGGGKKARSCIETRVYNALVGLRKEAARASKKPPYTVFHDTAIREVARALPRSLDELLQIKGIGAERAIQGGREEQCRDEEGQSG